MDVYESAHETVTCSIAQGSVLGLLIFIIYVSDNLTKVSQDNSIYMYMYADDIELCRGISCT